MKSEQRQERLIVFSRYPEPGTTKTRLAKTLGNRGAAALQQKLTVHTLVQVRQFQQLRPVEVSVYFDGGSREHMQEWLGPGLDYRAQISGDLGLRMAEAFAASFKQGYTRIVIIGTDCPDLKASHMTRAFESLRCNDLVLGPAADGGYYLIGLSRQEQSVFTGIPWGSAGVLKETLAIAAQKGLSIDLLETLSDVDRPEDLKHFSHHSDTK